MSLISEEILSAEILQAREQIDRELERYSQFDADCPSALREAISYCLLAPGKRIRPLLVMMAANACRGSLERALPVACAVEMVHTYSLIHDDLPSMDDDDMRRGRPSCHVAFGEATAILAGDALLARAFEVVSSEVQPQALAARCVAVLAAAAGACRLVGGQADDLAGPPEFDSSNVSDEANSRKLLIKWLENVHHRKTGALLSVSLQLGGMVSDATEDQLAALRKYGKNLGLAFQIVDDLLDLCGNQAKIGKPIGSDQSHGKITYPQLLGVEESRRLAQEQINSAIESVSIFGSDADELTRLAQFVVQRNF